jgi:hypothetical protein
MQVLFHQAVSLFAELKARYASRTIDAGTYRYRRGMILDHYLGVTDRYGNPNLPLMTNRLQRLRSFSLYLVWDEVLEEEQRMLLRSHCPPPSLGQSIPLLPPPRIPHMLQVDVGLLPPPLLSPAPVTRKQYVAIPPGSSMLAKPAKAFLDVYFQPYAKVAKRGGTKGHLIYRCKHTDCTMLCRLVPVPHAHPPLYVAEVKILCSVHTNHSARDDEHLLQAFPVRVLGPSAKSRVCPALSAAVLVFIDLLVEGNPKITPAAIMESLVGNRDFASLPFLTATDRREHTTRQVRRYRQNAERAKGLPKAIFSLDRLKNFVLMHELVVPVAFTRPSPFPTWPDFETFYLRYKAAYDSEHDAASPWKDRYQLLTLPVPPAEVFRELLGRDLNGEEKLRVARTVVFTSLSNLYCMLLWTETYPLDVRVVLCDGVFGLVASNKQVMVTISGVDVGWRVDQQRTTRSARPFGHALCPKGETSISVITLYLCLQLAASNLFGVDRIHFSFSTAICDHSDAIAGGLGLLGHDTDTAFGMDTDTVFGWDTEIGMCYFHLSRLFLIPRWVRRHLNNLEYASTAKSHVRLLHRSRSAAQFDACFALVMAKWREDGEGELATHFTKTFGPQTKWRNWYFCALGIPGLVPSNNPQESYNRRIQGDAETHGPISLRVSVPVFLDREAPKLLRRDYVSTSGLGFHYPVGLTKHVIATVVLADPEVDVRQSGSTYWVNHPRVFGHPITNYRTESYLKILAGDITAYTEIAAIETATFQLCCVQLLPEGTIFAPGTPRVVCQCKRYYYDLECTGTALVQDLLAMLPNSIASSFIRGSEADGGTSTDAAAYNVPGGFAQLQNSQLKWYFSSLTMKQLEGVQAYRGLRPNPHQDQDLLDSNTSARSIITGRLLNARGLPIVAPSAASHRQATASRRQAEAAAAPSTAAPVARPRAATAAKPLAASRLQATASRRQAEAAAAEAVQRAESARDTHSAALATKGRSAALATKPRSAAVATKASTAFVASSFNPSAVATRVVLAAMAEAELAWMPLGKQSEKSLKRGQSLVEKGNHLVKRQKLTPPPSALSPDSEDDVPAEDEVPVLMLWNERRNERDMALYITNQLHDEYNGWSNRLTASILTYRNQERRKVTPGVRPPRVLRPAAKALVHSDDDSADASHHLKSIRSFLLLWQATNEAKTPSEKCKAVEIVLVAIRKLNPMTLTKEQFIRLAAEDNTAALLYDVVHQATHDLTSTLKYYRGAVVAIENTGRHGTLMPPEPSSVFVTDEIHAMSLRIDAISIKSGNTIYNIRTMLRNENMEPGDRLGNVMLPNVWLDILFTAFESLRPSLFGLNLFVLEDIDEKSTIDLSKYPDCVPPVIFELAGVPVAPDEDLDDDLDDDLDYDLDYDLDTDSDTDLDDDLDDDSDTDSDTDLDRGGDNPVARDGDGGGDNDEDADIAPGRIVIQQDILRHITRFVCAHSFCSQFPWRQFASARHGTMRGMMDAAVAMARKKRHINGGDEVNRFLAENMGEERIDGTLPSRPPRLIGREHSPQTQYKVNDFCRYSSTQWFNDVLINHFMRGLAWMQRGEIHPRPDLRISNGERWLQHRIVGAGKPRLYLVSEQWSNSLFSWCGTGLATRNTESLMQRFLNMDLPADWTSMRSLKLAPNIRENGARPRPVHVANNEDWHSAFWPINITHSHWLCVVSCNATHTLYLYDFLYGFGSSEWHDRFQRKILDVIGEYLNVKCQAAGRSIVWKHKVVITKSLQEDGTNCGALLCMVAWFTTWFGRPPTEAELLPQRRVHDPTEAEAQLYGWDDLQNMRLWMAYSALTDRIWLPPDAEQVTDAVRQGYDGDWGPIDEPSQRDHNRQN